MRPIGSLPIAGCLVAVTALLTACGGGSGGDHHAAAAVRFHAPEYVEAAPVLAGDPADGRCAGAASAPCFSGVSDVLNGERRMLRIEDLAVGARTHNDGSPDDFFVGGIATTKGSAIAALRGSGLAGSQPTGTGSTPAVTGARRYAGAQDVLVSAVAEPARLSIAIDQGDGSILRGINGDGLPAGNTTPAVLSAVTADVDGDGLDEVVFATSSSGSRLQVMYGTESDSAGRGAAFGPSLAIEPPLAVAAGDFLGTGPLVAAAFAQQDGSLQIQYYTVDPQTRALSPASALVLQRPAGAFTPNQASIAVGRYNRAAFAGAVHDQMLIAVSDSVRVDLLSVDADFAAGSTSGTPVQRLRGISTQSVFTRAVLRAGKFDWSSPYDAVAYLLTDVDRNDSPTTRREFLLFTLDDNLDVARQTPAAVLSTGQCVYDMQVGNFDRRRPDPTPNAPAGATIHDPDLQIALLTSSATNDGGHCSGGDSGDATKGMTLRIYDVNVDPAQGALSIGANTTYVWSSFTEATLDQVSMAVPDLQGRSLVLGPPRTVTMSRVQPSAVIGAPPMHAEVVDGKVVNFSVAPDGFNAKYTSATQSKVGASTTDTMSYTFSAEESTSASYTMGDCDVGDCAEADAKASAKQALDHSQATLQGSFQSSSNDLSTVTSLADQLLVTESTLSVYVYPVLGRSVCPAAKPACAAAEQVPMTVVFAGPDSVSRVVGDATMFPSYQPPWMPGNVLSYPGTLRQLEAAGLLDPASVTTLTTPVTFDTSPGASELALNWSSGTNSGVTTHFDQNYSFQASMSFTLKAGLADVVTGSATASLDLSGSFGFDKLTDMTTSLDTSTGLAFLRSAAFPDAPRYRYLFTPYILSQQPVAATPASGTAQTAFGAIVGGYVVDPLAAEAGSAWRPLYAGAPDIGFTQPLRWQSELRASGGADCMLFSSGSSDVDCAVLGSRTPADPWSDEYHRMRGLFISDARTPGTGPQLGSIDAGTTLYLQARVHNFSFSAPLEGQQVRVRFYAMPWDTSTNRQASASRLIGTASVAATSVPPFSSAPDAPANWTLVGTTFDTTPYSGQDLVFWTVAWLEDAGGRLVPELADKGLTAIPATGSGTTVVDFAEAAALEQSLGNNVGFYDQVFHVFDARSSSAAAAPATATSRPTVLISEVGSSTTQLRRGERAIVAARVRTGDAAPRDGLAVHFFEGDPRQGGRLVGVQRLPRLAADSSYEFRAHYRPRDCGQHDLYAVAGLGTRFRHTARLERISVGCS